MVTQRPPVPPGSPLTQREGYCTTPSLPRTKKYPPMNTLTLLKLAKAVAVTHNGKAYPRSAQIEALKALQAFLKNLDSI